MKTPNVPVGNDTGLDNIWIIGDQFREDIELNGHPLLGCFIAGGTWFIKRFVAAALLDKASRIRGYDPAVFRRVTIKPGATLNISKRDCFPKALSPGKKPIHSVFRIMNAEYSEPNLYDGSLDFEALKPSIRPKDILILEDMAMGYRRGRNHEWRPILDSIKRDSPKSRQPQIIALLGRDVPDLGSDSSRSDVNDLWSTLWRNHRDQTLVVVNADLLRFKGANISRRVSWERTAQDFVMELHSRPDMKWLNDFAHVVVRFGVTAAVHCFKASGDDRYLLYYDTKAHDGTFRNVHEEGAMIGNNSIMVACIAKALMNEDMSINVVQRIRSGIKCAIPACQRLFRLGYPVPSVQEETWLEKWPLSEVFDEAAYTKAWEAKLPVSAMPTSVSLIAHAQVPVSGESWSIIKQFAPGAEMTKLAKRIVYHDIAKCINSTTSKVEFGIEIFAPIGEFGNLITLDRDEIESFRGVHSIIRRYLNIVDSYNQESPEVRGHPPSPLCIAVFGPPGAGKTFAVKEIAGAIRSELTVIPVTVNMAQLSSLEALKTELAYKIPYRVRTYTNIAPNVPMEGDRPGVVPMIFFDEFDSDFSGELGWLKCFLGPMEDGVFSSPTMWMALSSSIFVFAGGTKHTYLDFSRGGSGISSEERLRFDKAKGPDFVSRLRGHINIKGINRANSSDSVYVVRRAILLRRYLALNKLLRNNVAQIGSSVLHAMLKVSSYKHGARSMQALIGMCIPLHERIEKSSLPPAMLMDMHVDSSEFRAMMEDYQRDESDPPKTSNYLTS